MTRVAAIGQAGVPPVNERELQRAVIDLARSFGWGVTQSAAKAAATEAAQYGVPTPPLEGLIFHPRYSLGSEPGWPDLTLIRRRDRRLVFAELKTEKGVVSPRQAEVLDLLRVIEFDASCGEGPHLPPGFSYTTESIAAWRNAGRPESRKSCCPPLIQVHVWRPSDLASGAISEVLR